MARRQLTSKQERWFQLYMEIGNGSEAYRRAYDAANMSDRAIRVEASKLINHPESSGAGKLSKRNGKPGTWL
jgi:phage terminase small subunit